MLRILSIAGMLVALADSSLPFVPSPAPHLYSSTDPVCLAIYQENHITNGQLNESIQINHTIPVEWEPSGDKEGYSEQNKFVQIILCNVNKNRQDAMIPPLQWHYGLSYLARTVNPCENITDPSFPAYYGFNNIKKISSTKYLPGYWVDNGWWYAENWHTKMRFYQYPMNEATEQPDRYDLCPNRYYRGLTQNHDPFTISMWQWAFFIGCSPAHCDDGTKLNCLFTDFFGYPIHSSNANFAGFAFFKFSRDLIDASPKAQMDGGLPTCET
ncbi:uncharacterized protein LOC142350555 [Convolutriloba macropyga]|uniref:uncharacterized protein LOC142350555 n=1 Tax=Convolutriloba macropyga TaxID=536237 RepID=UPI003F51EF1C